MKEDYCFGRIDIKRNFNKRGGKFLYVIYIQGENERQLDWTGKIFFDKKAMSWMIELEKPILFSFEELKFIIDSSNLIREDLKDE